MRGDVLRADAFGEGAGGALGHAARVDENERRAVRLDQLRDPVVDFRPDFAGHDGFEGRRRDFELQVAVAAVAGVDDRAFRLGPRADEEICDELDRFLRRRKADALQIAAAQRFEAFQGQCEMRAALVGRDGVDLVDDDALCAGEYLAAGLRS